MSQIGFFGNGGGGGGDISQINGNTGTVTPSSGIVVIEGGNNINTTGSGDVLTVNVSGTTNHAVQIGNSTNSLSSVAVGSTGQVLIGATGADLAFGALGVNSGLTQNGVVLGNGSSALSATSAGTNGQVLLGGTSAAPAFATLTSTAGSVAYTPGSNALNIDVTNYVTSTVWTPVLTFGGSSTGITYTTQTGYYAQIGHLVIAQFSIILSSKGTQTGNMNITGLNFTLAGSVVNVPVNVYFYGGTWNLTASSANQGFYDGTNVVFNHITGTTANVTTFTNTTFTNTSSCTGTFCFVV